MQRMRILLAIALAAALAAPAAAQDALLHDPGGLGAAALAGLAGDPAAYRQVVLQDYEQNHDNPQAAARRGAYFRAVGNLHRAEQDLRAALRMLAEPSPRDADIWRELALTLEARGDLSGALGAWSDAIRLDPPALADHIARGGVGLKLADQAGAEADFRVVLAALGEDPDALLQIGDAHLAAGMPGRALEYYERALAAQPGSVLRLRLARAQWESGDRGAAGLELERVLAAEPLTAELLSGGGELAAEMGDTARALELFRRAAETEPALRYKLNLAQMLTELGDPAAQDEWDALVQDYAGHPAAWLARGSYFCGQSSHDAAAADFHRALALVPEFDEAELRWAACLEGAGNVDGAVVHYRRAIDLDPAPETYLELIRLLAGRPGRAAEVDGLWTELFALFPEHPETLLAHGERLMADGNRQAAIEVFRHGADIAPGDHRFPRRIADNLHSAGDFDGAVEHYAAALDLRYDAESVRRLARVYADSGSPRQAEAVWRSYESLHPNDAALAMAHGDELFSRGDYDEALAQFRRGQRLAPKDAEFYSGAAQCLIELDQPQQAVSELEAGLALGDDPQLYVSLARACELAGETDLAGRQYARGLELFPQDPELNRAYALFAQRWSSGEALGQLEQAAGVSGDESMYLRAAEQALAEGDQQRAENNYLAGLRANPADAEVATGLALLYACLLYTSPSPRD